MDNKRFLQILRRISLTPYEDIGAVIGFNDIYVTLTPYGEVKESIEWRIRELERAGKLEVFRADSVIYAVRLLP